MLRMFSDRLFGSKKLSLDCAVVSFKKRRETQGKMIGMLQSLNDGHSLLLKLPSSNPPDQILNCPVLIRLTRY